MPGMSSAGRADLSYAAPQHAKQGLNRHPGTGSGEGDIHESPWTPSELPHVLAMFSSSAHCQEMAGGFFLLHCWLLAGALGKMSKQTHALIQPGQPKVAAFPPLSPRDNWPVLSCCWGGCDGMLFGHLPGQLRAAAVTVGKQIVFSCVGFCQWGSSKRAKKGSSDEHLAAGTVNCSALGKAVQGGFLQMCDKYRHDLKI